MYIQFYARHNTKIKKNGLIVGFYVRVLKICRFKFLNVELNYIANSFEQFVKLGSFIPLCEMKVFFLIYERKSNKVIICNQSKILKYKSTIHSSKKISK